MAIRLGLSKIRTIQSPCNPNVLPFGGFWALLLLTSLLAAPVSSEPKLVTYRPSDSKSTNDQGQFVFPGELKGANFNTIFILCNFSWEDS